MAAAALAVAAAIAAGYVAGEVCAADPTLGGMGFHGVDFAAVWNPSVTC